MGEREGSAEPIEEMYTYIIRGERGLMREMYHVIAQTDSVDEGANMERRSAMAHFLGLCEGFSVARSRDSACWVCYCVSCHRSHHREITEVYRALDSLCTYFKPVCAMCWYNVSG